MEYGSAAFEIWIRITDCARFLLHFFPFQIWFWIILCQSSQYSRIVDSTSPISIYVLFTQLKYGPFCDDMKRFWFWRFEKIHPMTIIINGYIPLHTSIISNCVSFMNSRFIHKEVESNLEEPNSCLFVAYLRSKKKTYQMSPTNPLQPKFTKRGSFE